MLYCVNTVILITLDHLGKKREDCNFWNEYLVLITHVIPYEISIMKQ